MVPIGLCHFNIMQSTLDSPSFLGWKGKLTCLASQDLVAATPLRLDKSRISERLVNLIHASYRPAVGRNSVAQSLPIIASVVTLINDRKKNTLRSLTNRELITRINACTEGT